MLRRCLCLSEGTRLTCSLLLAKRQQSMRNLCEGVEEMLKQSEVHLKRSEMDLKQSEVTSMHPGVSNLAWEH